MSFLVIRLDMYKRFAYHYSDDKLSCLLSTHLFTNYKMRLTGTNSPERRGKYEFDFLVSGEYGGCCFTDSYRMVDITGKWGEIIN
jgi:hypothetical protein